MSNYKDPIITKLIEIYRANGPAEIRDNCFYGKPFYLPKNQKILPAVFFRQAEDQTNLDTNEADRSAKRYIATVWVNAQTTWQKGEKIIGEDMDLQYYISGMDANGKHLPESLMGILRKYRVLDGPNKIYIDLGSGTRARFGDDVVERGDSIFTREAQIEFIVTKREIRAVA
jgi:hypothetical protein